MREKFRTVKELKEIIAQAIQNEELKVLEIMNDSTLTSTKKRDKKRSPLNNINRYEFTLRILNGIKDTKKLDVNDTVNGSVNIGHIGELYCESKLTPNKRKYSKSMQGERDLPRYHMSEVKVISRTTKSNHWNAKRGALCIVQGDKQVSEGIYWINRDELSYEFSNGDKLDHKRIKKVINDLQIERVRVGA